MLNKKKKSVRNPARIKGKGIEIYPTGNWRYKGPLCIWGGDINPALGSTCISEKSPYRTAADWALKEIIKTGRLIISNYKWEAVYTATEIMFINPNPAEVKAIVSAVGAPKKWAKDIIEIMREFKEPDYEKTVRISRDYIEIIISHNFEKAEEEMIEGCVKEALEDPENRDTDKEEIRAACGEAITEELADYLHDIRRDIEKVLEEYGFRIVESGVIHSEIYVKARKEHKRKAQQ